MHTAEKNWAGSDRPLSRRKPERKVFYAANRAQTVNLGVAEHLTDSIPYRVN